MDNCTKSVSKNCFPVHESLEEFKRKFDDLPDESLESVLREMAVDEFEEWEASKSMKIDIRNCESVEQLELLNNFFVGIFGWSFDTLIERAKNIEVNNYEL